MKRLAVFLIALALLVGGAVAASRVSYNEQPASRIKSTNVTSPLGRGTGAASSQVRETTSSTVPLVRQAEKGDVSPALRNIPARVSRVKEYESGENENPPAKRGSVGSNIIDPVMQSVLGPLVMPAPIANFDGEYNEYGPIPPDTNGDVGRSHYIQIVNSGFTVFNKTGTILYGPTNNNVLFTGFGGICEATNSGDPLALYDPMADRWVLSWFTGQSNPTHQCFAVSSTGDPLGTWYRYDFVSSPAPTTFEDYPHLGVWPDAYYMTTNEFSGPYGGGNFAFDRVKMLAGDPTATMIFFGSADGGLLPSDFDGGALPPTGSPNYFFEWYDTSHLAEYKFHADFANPALSTFTGPTLITVAAFSFPVCTASREQCITQPGTTAKLETIGDRLMYRVQYRNFGGYESVVLNHTVNANSLAAPRWYELRSPNSPTGATVFQQGTFAPADGVHRWMGSITQDRMGNIAMGYSASSSTLFPSIRYAGRLVTDPLGTFAQGEATLFAGSGSEDFPTAPRWGDYSSISVDPTDDCTFWYTTEYFSQTALRSWRTRIGSFKFPSCVSQNTPTPIPTSTLVRPTSTSTATPCAGSISFTGPITNTDPVQTGRLGLSDPKSSCAVPKVVAALSDSLARHYKSYTYTNNSGVAQCVTVRVTQNCGNNALQSVTYLNSFNPASIQTNYLADGGASGHTFSYSFNLAAGQTAVVVALEVSPNIGCAAYTLLISPCSTAPALTNTPTATFTVTRTPTRTFTPIVTVTLTPPPTGRITGHLTWQGIAQPDSRNNGITATLSLCVSGLTQNYSVATDSTGTFTVTTGLPNGTYNWSLKGQLNLSNAGSLTIAGGAANVEMGLMRAGDCDNNNIINTSDFNILKNTFGRSPGQVGYDARGDLNRDNVVNSVDFNLQKINFGIPGTPLTCP
jgi:hypothetical protein